MDIKKRHPNGADFLFKEKIIAFAQCYQLPPPPPPKPPPPPPPENPDPPPDALDGVEARFALDAVEKSVSEFASSTALKAFPLGSLYQLGCSL